jgi:uncharacterized protein (TIGR00255 family)
MPLSSMTGFARVAGIWTDQSWAWEIRSVNAKGFDLRLRLPNGLDAVDTEARRMIGQVIIRGTVHVSLDLTRPVRTPVVRINDALVADLAKRLSIAASSSGLAPPSIDALLGIKGVVETEEQQPTDDEQQARDKALLESFEEALVALCAARQDEGEALRRLLTTQITRIEELTVAADTLPARSADAVRNRIARLVDEITGVSHIIDPQRLHQEAVLIAVKADVREELDRLKAHVAQAKDLLVRSGSIGRKLDFLAQEFSRETNTLCAKSNDVGLTAIGLDLKAVVEQFREQVQNVE